MVVRGGSREVSGAGGDATAAWLAARPSTAAPCELDRGRLVPVSPVGGAHGEVVAALLERLRPHVRRLALGWVTTETGFVLARDPDTVRGPDVAFVAAPRVPRPLPQAYFEGPPDLAIEVASPSDGPPSAVGALRAKATAYLTAGAQAVWLVDPIRRTVAVLTADGPEEVLGEGAVLRSSLLPGLDLPLADLFAGL